MQRGLDAAHRGINELRDVFQRVIEDVLEEHAGALHRRKRQHEAFDGLAEGRPRRVDRRDGVGLRRTGLCVLPDLTAAHEIDTPIVSNPEQPRSQRPVIVKGVQLAIGLEQCLLKDVLAVHHRPGHA